MLVCLRVGYVWVLVHTRVVALCILASDMYMCDCCLHELGQAPFGCTFIASPSKLAWQLLYVRGVRHSCCGIR